MYSNGSGAIVNTSNFSDEEMGSCGDYSHSCSPSCATIDASIYCSPNAVTMTAMQEADRGEGTRFDSADALFKDLGI